MRNEIEEDKPLKHLTLLILRLVIVGILAYSIVPKLANLELVRTEMIDSGLPGVLGPIVLGFEIIALAAILVGFMSKWASLAMAMIVLTGILTVHMTNSITAAVIGPGVVETNSWKFILDIVIMIFLIIIATVGPGMLAVKNDGFAVTEDHPWNFERL